MGYPKIQSCVAILIWATLSYSIAGLEERELFRKWKVKHGKAYSHVGEAEKRFENFKSNLRFISEKKKTSSHKLGLNRFADMSNEEFKEVYLSRSLRKPPGHDTRKKKKKMTMNGARSCVAPSSLDWRKKGAVTAVKDQGNCGTHPYIFTK